MARTKAVDKNPKEDVLVTDVEKTVEKVELETSVEDNKVTTRVEKHPYRVKSSIDPNMYVTVRNGFNGKLVYKSKRTNEKFVWDGFGTEQDIELQELKSAKNSSKDFFVNNWFMIDDPEIIEYLGVQRYYAHSIKFDEFDDLFNKEPKELAKLLREIPEGQRKTVAYRARQLIAEGKIDSIKVINTLEKNLGIELIER